MKRIFYWAPVMLLIVVIACKDKASEEQQVTPANIPVSASNANQPTTLSTDIVPASPNVQPAAAAPVNISVPTTRTTVAAGMNPAHGEPGHRCDIPVGAPLNSPPGKQNPAVASTNTPAAASQQTITLPTTTAPATAAKVAPGMNPAHGEPDHRCDIAVGAPLNSPPGGAAPTGATTPVSISPVGKKQ